MPTARLHTRRPAHWKGGPGRKFLEAKNEAKRKVAAEKQKNKVKKLNKEANDADSCREVGHPLLSSIKQAHAWPDQRLGSKELEGLAEVLGIFKDVREMKVRPKYDFLRQHVYNKGWLTQRRTRQR